MMSYDVFVLCRGIVSPQGYQCQGEFYGLSKYHASLHCESKNTRCFIIITLTNVNQFLKSFHHKIHEHVLCTVEDSHLTWNVLLHYLVKVEDKNSSDLGSIHNKLLVSSSFMIFYRSYKLKIYCTSVTSLKDT